MTTIPEDFIMLLDEISRAGETDVEWPLVRAVIAVQLKWVCFLFFPSLKSLIYNFFYIFFSYNIESGRTSERN